MNLVCRDSKESFKQIFDIKFTIVSQTKQIWSKENNFNNDEKYIISEKPWPLIYFATYLFGQQRDVHRGLPLSWIFSS